MNREFQEVDLPSLPEDEIEFLAPRIGQIKILLEH